MPESSFVKKWADGPLFRHYPRLAGGTVVLFGLLIIVSWYAHWQSILQMRPNSAPMQYNTALCFILFGVGLFLLTTSHAKIAPWLGAAAGFLALLTALEQVTGQDFHIDQVLFKPYFEANRINPGRMSPLAAVCFIFVGAGFVLTQARRLQPRWLAGTGMLACIVAVIACVAILGYVFGIEAAYGWGAYSRMAINTAVVFFLLSMGLLIWTVQMGRTEEFNFLRWLPGTGSATLMLMIVFVSAANTVELKRATFWRKHTVEVILDTQFFEENLIDIQRGARGYYMTAGDSNALASHYAAVRLEPGQFNQLAVLTSDNPVQQQRLKKLASAMEAVFSYDERLIALHDQQGLEAALKTDAGGEGRRIFGNARDILRAFSQEEQKLLDWRGALEQADSNNAEHLLIFGSVTAVVLLVMANYLTSREMKQRRRVEIQREKLIGELQQALAQVKSLSGLIPICGWCKSIRSDQGFWLSVEEYVHNHGDATVSHGMCPSCSAKFKKELATAEAGS